jgi:surface antigen
MKRNQSISVAAIGLTISGIVACIINTNSANAGYMEDYFRDGMTIKLVTPKGFNVNLPYPTNGGMINTFEPDNTDDWKFVVIRSSADGFKLKRVGTNHLITTKDFPSRNLTPLEAWQDVGGEDKFQTWVATPTRPGFFAICLKAQRDQCMNVPNSKNRTRLTTYKFDANDQDQMFSAIPIKSSPDNPVISRINAALDKLNGIYSITDPNGYYPGQCVSFVKRFTKELGITMGAMGGDGGARYGFINFNQPGLSLSATQANKISFTGSEQPQVGDIIFFDATSINPWGHVAVVQSISGNGKVIIQESNADGKAPNTYVTRGEINLTQNPPKPYYGRVMGWLRLKL